MLDAGCSKQKASPFEKGGLRGISHRTSNIEHPTPYQVAVLLCESVLATSATLPIEMLRTAEATARGRHLDFRSLQVHCLSMNGEPVSSASGFDLAATGALADAPQCDLVHIPGQWRNPRPALRKYQAYLPWLKQQHEGGAIITAVGTGACFPAAAGLLDGKPATTHWYYFDTFQKQFPAVELKRQYFITQAGNLYCAASVNTLAELMAHVIYRWYGRAVANNVERNFFHEIRDSFEPSRYFDQHVEHHPDEAVLQAQIWMQDNFARQVRMDWVAAQFGMSVRSFNRRFRNALGRTPVDYLQELRLNSARDLLKNTNLTIAEVSSHCGYQDVTFFTRLFTRRFQATPGKYRETVRAKLFSTKGLDT